MLCQLPMRIRVEAAKAMNLLTLLLQELRKPPSGQSCANCKHFIDYRSDNDEPGEPNGYCGELVDRLGFDKALEQNAYGGRWVVSSEWCQRWETGPSLWIIEKEISDE